MEDLTSQYKGGETARWVLQEISKRWGKTEAAKYNPYTNCFTFRGWLQRGYVVKKGEKAIRSITFIKDEKIDLKTKQKVTVKTYPKNIFLFYYLQVAKLKKKGGDKNGRP